MKDGRRIEAPVRARTERSVTLDWYGVPVTYEMDDIARVEPGTGSGPQMTAAAPAQPVITGPPTGRPGTRSAEAAPPPAAAEALVDELLQRAGLLAQLGQVPALVEARLSQHRGLLAPERYDRLRALLREAYRPEALSRVIRARFLQAFDPHRYGVVVGWLRAPHVEQAVAAELQAGDPASWQELTAFAGQLLQAPPSERRVALIRRLNDATRASEESRDVTLAVAEGVHRILGSVDPAGALSRPEAWRAEAEQIRIQSAERLAHQTELFFLFTYRGIPDEALARYVNFWASDLGAWFHQRSTDALLESLAQAASMAVQELTPPDGS